MKLSFSEERQLLNIFMQPCPQGPLSSSRQERERGDEVAVHSGKLTLSTQLIRPIFLRFNLQRNRIRGMYLPSGRYFASSGSSPS